MFQLVQKYGLFALLGMLAMSFASSAMASSSRAGTSSNELADGAQCGTGTLGGMICNVINSTSTAPGLIVGFAYMAGLILGFLGVLKLKDHVENPNQTPIWDPIKRFVAGGSFFALPYVAQVVRTTIQGATGSNTQNSGFNGTVSNGGLDAMIINLMSDIMVPLTWAVGVFGWIAGLILVFIGISRIMKTEQEGPRGPTGIGTIMTFLVAGALFSLNSIIAYINVSIFGNDKLLTNGVLEYTDGLGGTEAHVHAVISSIIAFAMVLGWISVVRGLFIMRGVSEGNSQASMMAALTHLIGGVLAINLGGVIMAVQTTLGISQYGITFN